MEVYVTMRVDFVDQPKKSKILKKKAAIGKALTPNYCKNLNQESLRLDWDCLGGDWDELIPKTIDKLVDSGAEGLFAVIAGDDGWYEVWTHVKGTLRVYHDWGALSLEEQLDGQEDFLTFINGVRKEEIKKHKDTPFKKKYTAKPVKMDAAINPKMPAAEHWEPSNKDWLDQRKMQWVKIEEYLTEDLSNRFVHENFLSFHKELFFYGTNSGHPVIVNGRLNPSLHLLNVLGRQYAHSSWLTFLVWYHPRPDTIDIDGLLEDYVTTESELDKLARDYLFLQKPVFSEEGVFYGKEEYLVKVFFPRYEIEHKLDIAYMNESIDIGVGQNFKYELVKLCLLDSLREMSSGESFLPNAIGQYLWGHLSYLLEHHPECVFADPETGAEDEVKLAEKPEEDIENLDFWDRLKRAHNEVVSEKLDKRTKNLQQNRALMEDVLTQIMEFDQRSNDIRNRPTTKTFVASMMKKYNDRELSKPLLTIWDNLI